MWTSFIRYDQPHNHSDKSAPAYRAVLRCQDLSLERICGAESAIVIPAGQKAGDSWPSSSLLGLAAQDTHSGVDVYNSAPARYGSWWLFFPSIFRHFRSDADAPYGLRTSNDGLLDAGFMVSEDGVATPKWCPAWNSLAPWVGLGVNSCPGVGSLEQPGSWCPFGPDEARTSPGTSKIFVAAGLVLSDGPCDDFWH